MDLSGLAEHYYQIQADARDEEVEQVRAEFEAVIVMETGEVRLAERR